jgi:hypothetical protein
MLFTFPEYCFITVYLIIVVQWITSLLNAYGHGSYSLVNGSSCRRWTRILFFTACLIVFLSISIFYTLLWFKPDSTSEGIERSCTFLNICIVAFAIFVAFIMYCCVLTRHMNTSYVSLLIVKTLSHTFVVASSGRIFRAVILLLSSFMAWQDSMEQSTLSMSIISILSLCELFPLFLLLDWRLVFLLLGGEEIVEAKIGDLASISLFLPFAEPQGNSAQNQNSHNSTTNTNPRSATESLLSTNSQNNNDYYYPRGDSSTSSTDTYMSQPQFDDEGGLADPLLLPQFNIQTAAGPCFDPLTLSLPRALFLPNNETINSPPKTIVEQYEDRQRNDPNNNQFSAPHPHSPQNSNDHTGLTESTSSSPSSPSSASSPSSSAAANAELHKANKLWNGLFYGFYFDKLTTMSQIIYTNPLWITCSGYTQSHRRIAVKRFVLPGLDETALRELGIEAYTRGQLSLTCPNILPVLGFNVSGSSLCIISDYKQRRSLFDFLRSTEKNIAPIGILKLALGIAIGMEHLHNNEIVHGHFHSRNVILDEHLQVYISDVGDRFVRIFAEAMYGSHIHTQWSAPEVLSGATPTKSSDVYSFGVICWELCYRLIPFQHYSLEELRHHVGKRGDRLLLPSFDDISKAQMLAKNQGKSLRHVISYEFITLITKCLQNVNIRPSFEDIVTSLQAIIQQMNSHKD